MGEANIIGDELQRVLERGRELLASDEDIQRWEARQGERDRRDRLESSGISERLDERGAAAIVADRPESTRALELARAWLASSRPALVLLGDPGVGKTCAAAWALARVPGRYVRAQDLCEMRADWRQRHGYQVHLRTELLVIDELGIERDVAQAVDVLQDVVDARQRTPRRTLFLGNLDKPALVARYDKRTLDRLGIDSDESGIALMRALRGPSMRRAER